MLHNKAALVFRETRRVPTDSRAGLSSTSEHGQRPLVPTLLREHASIMRMIRHHDSTLYSPARAGEGLSTRLCCRLATGGGRQALEGYCPQPAPLADQFRFAKKQAVPKVGRVARAQRIGRYKNTD